MQPHCQADATCFQGRLINPKRHHPGVITWLWINRHLPGSPGHFREMLLTAAVPEVSCSVANHLLLLPTAELLPDRGRRCPARPEAHTQRGESCIHRDWVQKGNSKTAVTGRHLNTPSRSVLMTVLLTGGILLYQHMPLPWPSDRSVWAQSQVPAPRSMYKGSRNTHSLLPLPGSQWMLDSLYRFLPLTTQTRSNFQYTRSSGADNKGKVSGRQRTVCTHSQWREPVLIVQNWLRHFQKFTSDIQPLWTDNKYVWPNNPSVICVSTTKSNNTATHLM